MKKLIALLLVALMAVTCALACAEEAPTPPMTIVNAVTFDHAACRRIMTDAGLTAEQIEFVEGLLALIEASGQKLVVAEDGFEYDMILDGNTVATLAGDITPEGVSVGSNLFPHYILTVSNATIEALLARFDAEEPPEAEVSAGLLPELIALTQESGGEMIELAKSAVKVGEPVTGEYAVDGDTYNAMLPVSVDTRAIADGVIDLADKIIHSEPVVKLQNVLRSVDIDIPLETPAIEDVPAVNATVYACQDEAGNANGPICVEAGIDEADGSPLIQARVRVDGENVRVKFGIPGIGLEVQYEQFMSEGGGFMRLDVNAGAVYVGLSLEMTLGDESHLSFNVYYPDPSKPLVCDDIAVTGGGMRRYVVESKKKTALSLERLMAGEEENGSWISLLADVAIYSAVEIMSTTNHAQPEVKNLIELLWG